ncbi:glutathione S-transferase [Agrobacterium tumefaciens]|uniref:glutathione S-transferase n=1 Tax=Agrobacterium tumefaciens TaxID=358 RepID=UPI001573498A|nr:glutathione S-transferase [Agrobacterium tumefaciens]
MKLIIGTKRYSTWSMRPWVFMRTFEIPFTEEIIPFEVEEGTRRHTAKTDELMQAASPNGRVPVLVLDSGDRLNESLAICEYLSEVFLSGKGWPARAELRAKARAVTLEMATGFTALRRLLPMSIGSQVTDFAALPNPAVTDVDRIRSIISECRTNSHGSFLFGDFSIADAFYAPVVMRFQTYKVPVPPIIADYMEAIKALPAVTEWCADAIADQTEIGAITDIVTSYPTEIAAACKI